LSDLETPHVQQAMNAIARKPAQRGGVLARSTVAGVLAVLRSALGLARARGYVRFNAAAGVLKVRGTRVTAAVWTTERIASWRATGRRPPVAVWDPDGVAKFPVDSGGARIADEDACRSPLKRSSCPARARRRHQQRAGPAATGRDLRDHPRPGAKDRRLRQLIRQATRQPTRVFGRSLSPLAEEWFWPTLHTSPTRAARLA
jgi:hypothetical protein